MAQLPIRYDIHRPACSYHYDVTGPDDSQKLLFCKVNANKFKPKPDLILYAGSDATAPIAAVSHMVAFSQHNKMGLYRADEPDHVMWEDLRRSNSSGSKHHFSIEITEAGSEKKHHLPRRVTLVWKRTSSVTVQGGREPHTRKSHRGYRGWKLFDEANPSVILAVFTFDRSFGRRGLLQINADYGLGFNRWVLISLLTMYERVAGS